MKKIYTKPEILFEDFAMSDSIAAGCEVITDTPNAGNCGVSFGKGRVLFLDGMSLCTRPVKDGVPDADGLYDGYCYHVPSQLNNLFNS